MEVSQRKFEHIWCVDFEFQAIDGNIPHVICMVAHDFVCGETIHLWEDELEVLAAPPFSTDENTLYIAYFASAEMSCHLALGWPLPENVLDLYTEFRNLTNGLPLRMGSGLLGALSYYGKASLEAVEKDSMRDLALRGGPWSAKEKQSLLDYCESDVMALVTLYKAMRAGLDIERALFRGGYMKAVGIIEFNGIPIDLPALSKLRDNWVSIQESLIEQVDHEYNIYDGRVFKQVAFSNWLQVHDIPWPLLDSGQLDLKDDTFRTMAMSHPSLQALYELRRSLSQLKLNDLSVGVDERNRCLLSPFRARTSRNQPSTTKFIFGNPAWVRHLIKPQKGYGIAYIDWSQQEFGIAAALSGDQLMMEAYASGDPYLAFAKQAGAVPEDATKETHKSERDQFKACVLAVQYGMSFKSLAIRINQPEIQAKALLQLHRETYKVFWEWSDACLDYAMLHGKLWTVFGWAIHVTTDPNPRSLRNFPMQANGAEMLRLAIIKAVEAGITVCAPVHDAILIEAPLSELDEAIEVTQQVMEEASKIILDGFALRTDVDVVRYPDRYTDPRGEKMWSLVSSLLQEREEPAH